MSGSLAYLRHVIMAVDIKGAYLNTKLKTVVVHMRIPPYLAKLLMTIYRKLHNQDIKEYFENDGSLLVTVSKFFLRTC